MSRVCRRPSRAAGALLPAALLLALAGPARAADLPCGDQAEGRTRCSRVLVPLDRTGAVEGRVGLSVRTIQRGARRPKVRREAVLFLAGGPGQAATSLAGDVARELAPLLRRRDLVAVDTRGTGRSSDLIVCPELETSAVTGLSVPEAFRSCARRLGPAIDAYGTSSVVEDLEAVRVAGGYDRLLLVGVSYGTFTAQRYAAAHPERVSGLVLDSPVDATVSDPFSLATFRAIPHALANVCTAGACRGVTDDVRGDFARTRARLPATASVDDGRGRRRPATVDATVLLGLVQAGDVDPTLRAALPAVLRSAGRGDAAPLVRLARGAGVLALPGDDEDPSAGPASAGSISTGAYVATVCRDTRQPWAPATPPGPPRRAAALAALAASPAHARGGWSPEVLVDLTPAGICQEWPGSAEQVAVGPAPDVPTLVLSGEDDTRTSPEEARRVAARLPGTTLVSVPGNGHSLLGSGRGCVAAAVKAFAGAGRPVACRRPTTLPPVAPLDPASPAEFGRTPAARAREVARRTVYDALRSALSSDLLLETPFLEDPPPIRVAGLRSGTGTLAPDGTLSLRRMGYVPGTAVTGTIGEGRRVRVLVRGTGVRDGRYLIPNPLRDERAVAEVLGLDLDELATAAPEARALRRILAR